MKRITSALLALIISLSTFAHEGMWIPSLLKIVEGDMQAEGMKLTAEDIYSINNSSLKDAIVHFGGGCTAEIVSNQGLILTNHHCGLSQVQSHSSVENDYIKDGFWAMSKQEELKNPGLTATIIVKIEDVTKAMNAGISDDMDEKMAYKKRFENMESIVAKATIGNNYEAVIKPFYYGNEYYMIVTKTFKDVRLVGAPPSGVGKFGGDTDNWIWPRHTGDFSVFRIYAGQDNEPAEISDDNKPYTPDYHLKVSMEGVKENDFTMVFGFPGTTDQYLTSYEVDDYINVINPKRIAMRTASLKVIDASMAYSDKIRIQYTSKQARISNAHKKWIGQNLGLKEKNALGKKKALEAEFLKRLPRDGKYKNVLQDLKANQEKYIKYDLARKMFIEIWYYGPELIRYAHKFEGLTDEKTYGETHQKLTKGYKGFYKNFDVGVDKKIFNKLVPMYCGNLDPSLRPDGVPYASMKTFSYAENIYKKSVFTDSTALKKLLNASPKKVKKILAKDPIYQLSQKIYLTYKGEVEPMYYDLYLKKDALMKKFLAAQMEYFPEKKFFADANSTLRLTYGKVEGTAPRDGMKYTYYTTIDGIIQKNNTGQKDFEIPARIRELWEKKEYGPYTTDGELRVCFLGSNHTTGGNSGSPALNGEGHLVGINFDRSWESTMSDIMFDPSICRNIMVDIKYVLWMMDIYAGAGHLVQEMDLVDGDYRMKENQKVLKMKLKTYSNRIKDVPNDVYAYLGRAEAHKEIGDMKGYEVDIDKVLELDSKNVSAMNEKAKLLEGKNQDEEALKLLKQSLKLNSIDNADAFFTRGLIYAKQSKFKEAIADFDKVIDIDYTFYKAYYNRGVCYNGIGDVDEACKNFEIAKGMGDEKAESMHHLNCEFGAW